MGYIVFIDTETTGLPPRSVTATSQNFDKWDKCRLVQIAWEIRNDGVVAPAAKGQVVMKRSLIIAPDGFEIPDDAAAIHGISTDRAKSTGDSLSNAIDQLFTDISVYNVHKAVSHNITFDSDVLLAELYRNKDQIYAQTWTDLPKFCTMREGTPPGKRWEKLPVMYERLCGILPDSMRAKLHDASMDTYLCAEIYFALDS